MDKPFFSVIVPTHNGADRLPVSLGSVLKQTCRNYELIVVCDDCEDRSAEIAKSYGAEVICVDFHRDGLARNAGLDVARGDWILFLDDDDWFMHEYCFDQLATQIMHHTDKQVDVISFAFIWKDNKYYIQSQRQHCSMVWSKAWKRSFLQDKHFEGVWYGSDSSFFNRYIRDNPDCHVSFWDNLMYYYNHMREGSLTDMLVNKPPIKLDMIITHYNEPWEVGKPLFDSIQLQVCANYNEVNFILVQDGEENALPWDTLLADYSFHVNVITLPEHQGVAVARNAGIDSAVSDWIMFMDFDDMLADIATFSQLLKVFPVTEEVDIIHSKYVREGNEFGKIAGSILNCEDEKDFRMIGKLYRKSFLNEHGLRFRTDCQEACDFIFNCIAFAETYYFRFAQFSAPFYPFFKRLRKDGAFSTVENLNQRVANLFKRDVIIADQMSQRNHTANCHTWMLRILADAYHSIRSADMEPDENKGVTDDLILFWKDNKSYFNDVTSTEIEIALDESESEAMSLIQDYYNYHGMEFYMQNDMISFDDFLQFLDAKATETDGQAPQKEPQQEEKPDIHAEHAGERAVVYCGTKEVYINMIASVKSLLATTPVDKVFFLIEDDEFPYELPDIVETRNVKDCGLFDTSGPNYNNCWTYMCLMRTAFPKMFPEYEKILSLDVDVVVTDNVSDLWDIDLTDYYFAGVQEEGRIKNEKDDMYANFGVIMMNLKKLRDDGLGEKLIEAVNTEHFMCPEQDCFNKYCKGHIYRLPNDFNVTPYSHITGDALHDRILHYAGLKYWKHFGPVKKYYNLSWDEIMKLQEEKHG